MADIFRGPEKRRKHEHVMHFEEDHLASFKDWPFDDDCACTPKKMAEAGFFHCPTDNEPDLVKCFVCQKELDGWEPTDNPWEEHRSHSGACPFLKLRDHSNMTVGDLLKMTKERYNIIFNKATEKKIQALEEHMKEAKDQIENMNF